MDTTADVVMEGRGWNHNFGANLSPAGDVNGDGYDDVIVAAIWDDYDGAGSAYIFFGGENMDSLHDVYIERQESDGYLWSVAGIGDINVDEFDDVLVGCPYHSSPGVIGKASIFFGGNPMDSLADKIFWGNSTHVGLGLKVATAGDTNGDSFPDIIISSIHQRVQLFYGGPEMDTVADADFQGEPVLPTDFGYRTSSAGDLNKDGFDDIMIGDPAINVERVYIFFGGTQVDTIADVILDKPDNLSDFCYQLSSLGDINGDGYDEVAVSSFSLEIDSCRVLIYTSNPTSVDEKEETDSKGPFHLVQNYPNPFNSLTTINYQIPGKGGVKLTIYNILGQRVTALVDEYHLPGGYRVSWEGKNYKGERVASGIYFYRLQTETYSKIKRMVFLK